MIVVLGVLPALILIIGAFLMVVPLPFVGRFRPFFALVANALALKRTVRYELIGKITSREPKRDFDFKFESALSPVPGLDGMLR